MLMKNINVNVNVIFPLERYFLIPLFCITFSGRQQPQKKIENYLYIIYRRNWFLLVF